MMLGSQVLFLSTAIYMMIADHLSMYLCIYLSVYLSIYVEFIYKNEWLRRGLLPCPYLSIPPSHHMDQMDGSARCQYLL